MSNKMFKLKQITTGSIAIEVHDQDAIFETIIDDFNDDLQKLSDFVTLLMAGGYPTVYVSDHKNCLWTYDEDETLKLHCEFDPNARNLLSKISIKTNRSALISALQNLVHDIAFHENFARGYLFFANGGAEEDKFYYVIDREWEEGVKAGRFPDDIYLKDAYEDRRFIEEFPLTELEMAILKENQEMLLSTSPERANIIPA